VIRRMGVGTAVGGRETNMRRTKVGR